MAIAESYMQTQVALPSATYVPGMPKMTPPTPIPTLTADQLDLLRIQSLIEVDFDYLQDINPDIIGWIFMERENINYPIVQGGQDNYFYLTRLPDKTPNRLGSIFMERDNKPDFSDDTTVLLVITCWMIPCSRPPWSITANNGITMSTRTCIF